MWHIRTLTNLRSKQLHDRNAGKSGKKEGVLRLTAIELTKSGGEDHPPTTQVTMNMNMNTSRWQSAAGAAVECQYLNQF